MSKSRNFAFCRLRQNIRWLIFAAGGLLGTVLPAPGQTPLALTQTPASSGFFTTSQTDTLAATGVANAKTYTVEVEGGDFLTLAVSATGINTYPRIRLKNAGGTTLASDDGTQQGQSRVQNFAVTTPGTYTIQVYSDHAVTAFTLRVDAGRGFPLELETNDTDLTASSTASTPAGGTFTGKIAGALDFSPDYYLLGSYSTGNSLALAAGIPSTSTLIAGDTEYALFRGGSEAAPAVVSSGATLNHTVTTAGDYYLRVRPASLAGRAMRFDAVDDGVNLNNPGALRITGDQTIEMWLKPDDFAQNRNIWSKAYGGEGSITVLTDGTVDYYYGTGGANGGTYSTFNTQRRLIAGQWNHFAVVRQLAVAPQKVLLYLNGQLVNSFNAPYFPAVASSLNAQIGFGYTNRYKGEMDELRVWNVARTGPQIAAGMAAQMTGSESGLVAYYKFEEGSGTTLTDATANHLDGIIAGAPVWTGTPGAVQFAPARQGLKAQYLASLTVTDGQAPAVVSTFLSVAQGPDYNIAGLLYNLGTMAAYRGQNGTSFNVQLTGLTAGSVWGTGMYTDDSTLAAAAVHAGLLEAGETGIVTVTVQPGQASYAGTVRNGVSTADYPAYAGSFSLSRYSPPAPPTLNGVYTGLRITFSEWMKASTIRDSANFELRHAGADSNFANGDETLHPLTNTTYTGDSPSALLQIGNGPLQPGLYRLRVFTGVQDRAGNALPAMYETTFTVLAQGSFTIESRSNDTLATATPLTVPQAAGFDGSFNTGFFRASGANGWRVKLLDLNGDGNKEALVSGFNSATLRVFPGNADGTFGASVDYSTGTNPWDIALIDFDHDGDLDVVVSCYSSDRVDLFRNLANGTLTPAGTIAVGDGPLTLAQGSFNGDIYPDLAVANNLTGAGGRSLSVLLGTAAGSFTESKITVVAPSFRPYGLAAGDIDGDGDADIIAGDMDSDQMTVFRNNAGTWAAPVYYAMDGVDPYSVALADFDHDGRLDAVVAPENRDAVNILKGNADGTFQTFQRLATGSSAVMSMIETPDIDGDGWADLVVPRTSGFVVFYNQASATAPSFSTAQRFLSGNYISSIAVADLTHDGRPDIAAMDWNNGRLYTLPGNGKITLPADATVARLRHGYGRGVISATGDLDYFSFSVPAGYRAVFAVDNPGAFGSAGLSFRLSDPDGVDLFAINTGANGIGDIGEMNLNGPGTYFLRVGNYYDYRGEYQFRVTLVQNPVRIEGENNDSLGNANDAVFTSAPGVLNAAVTGYASEPDTNGDYFRLGNLAQGSQITLNLSIPATSPLQAKMTIFKTGGVQVAESAFGAASLAYTVPAGGESTYYVRVISQTNTRGLHSEYLMDMQIADLVPPQITSDTLPVEASAGGFPGAQFTLNFSEDMTAAPVNAVSSYQLRCAGADNTFGNGDDVLYALAPAVYTSGLSETLTITDGPLQAGKYRFTAFTTLTDKLNNGLAANYVRNWEVQNVAGYITESRNNGSAALAGSLSVAPSAAFDQSFTPGASTAGGSTLWGMKLLDLNGDGNPEAIAAGHSTSKLKVFPGAANGTFGAPVEYTTAVNPWDVELVDIDHDGDLDVAVSCHGSDRVDLFTNPGNGTLTAAGNVVVGDGPTHIAKGKFNADSNTDLAVGNYLTGTGGRSISILIGTAGGSFTESKLTVSNQSFRPYGVVAADFNGDGLDDIATCDQDSDKIAVFLNTGGGIFGTPSFLSIDHADPTGIAAADVDHDGKIDIISCSDYFDRFNVLRGVGNGTFQPFISVALNGYSQGYFIETPDVDGDGWADLVFSRVNGVTVLYNTGTGSASSWNGPATYSESGYTGGTAVSDVNHDGRPDIVAAAYDQSKLYVISGNSTQGLATDAADSRLSHSSFRGNLTDSTDQDWWSFSAQAGDRIFIASDSPGNPGGAGRAFNIFDDQGNNLGGFTGDNVGRGQMGPFTATRPGRYYLRVQQYYFSYGEYRARVTLVKPPFMIETENNDAIGNANILPLTLGLGKLTGSVFGLASGADPNGDTFGVGNLTQGTQIALNLALPAGSPLSATMRIFKADGTQMAVSAAGAANLSYTVAAGQASSYFFRITGAAATLGMTSLYTADVTLTDTVAPVVTSCTLPAEGATVSFPLPDFTIGFSEDMQAALVKDPSRYELVSAGPDPVFGNGNDVVYSLTVGNYASGLSQSLHIVDGPLQPGAYKFTVSAALADLSNLTLTAPYVRLFTIQGVPGFVTEDRSNNTRADADIIGTVPGAAFDGSYAAGAPKNIGGAPLHGIALFRLNGDSFPDAIVSEQGADRLSIFPGAAGSFGTPATQATGDDPRFVLKFDYDKDGDFDLAVPNFNSDTVSIFRNDLDGVLHPVTAVPAGDGPVAAAAGDFNGDGKPDLIVTNNGTGTGGRSLSLITGDALGGFVQTKVGLGILPAWQPYNVAAADFDGNGLTDIVATDWASRDVLVFLATGGGSFAAPVRYLTDDTTVSGVAVGDLNGDGKADIVAASDFHNRISYLTGAGNGTFLDYKTITLPSTSNQYQVRLIDVNADGWPDIVAPRWDGLTILKNRASSTVAFDNPLVLQDVQNCVDADAGDLNGDGILDLVAAGNTSGNVYRFLGQSSQLLTSDPNVANLRQGYGRGQLTDSADVDYYSFSGKAGERVSVGTISPSGASSNGLQYQIYDQSGGGALYTFNSDFTGFGTGPQFVLPFDGRFFLRVAQYYTTFEEYRFRVSLLDSQTTVETEANDSLAQASPLTFAAGAGSRNAKAFGYLWTNDSTGDTFALGNLASGTQINVNLTRPQTSTLTTPVMRLFRENGTEVAASAAGGASLTYNVAAGQEGGFFVRMTGVAGERGLNATYNMAISLSDGLPPQVVASTLPPDGGATIDLLNSFGLTFNEDLLADTVAAAANYALREAGPDTVLGSSDDITLPMTIGAYTNGTAASYGIPAGPLPPGSYRLTVSGLKDTYGNLMTSAFVRNFTISQIPGFTTASAGNNTAATATTLGLSESPAGFLNGAGRGRRTSGSDEDYWAFNATAGQKLTMDVSLLTAPSYFKLNFELRAPDNSVVFSRILGDPDTGGFAPVTLPAAGRYVLRIFVYYDHQAEYRFRLSLINPSIHQLESEANDTRLTADPLTLAHAGSIDSATAAGLVSTPSDLDYFSLGAIPAGRTVFLNTLLPSGSSLLPVIALYNSAGVFVSEASGSPGDGTAEITINTPDSYFMLVRGNGGTGDFLSTYVAEVQVRDTASVNIPNLQVTALPAPPQAGLQSGSAFTWSFTVKNSGTAGTGVTAWTDRLVLSQNLIFGDADDIQIGIFPRSGALAGAGTYTVTGGSAIPAGASGSFYLIARTDYTDEVDELLLEGDNTTASPAFNASLAPYPNLIVSALNITGPVANQFNLAWNLQNTGNAAAATGFKERIRVVNTTTGVTALDDIRTPGLINAGATLARTDAVTATAPGLYQVTITADSDDTVYEHDGVSHAAAEVNSIAGSFQILQFWNVTVSPSNAAHGSAAGGGTFLAGSGVTVTATPNTSTLPYQFVRWTEGGVFASASASYSFSATANRSLVAEFALPVFQVTATVVPAGAGTVSGTGLYSYGTAASLTATASTGYVFHHWEESSVSQGQNATLPVTVNSARALQAIFAEANPTHVVTTATAPASLGAVTGGGTFNNGQVSAFSAPASVIQGDTEYLFDHFNLNGVFFGSQRQFSKTFSTLDPPAMTFAAVYTSRSLKPAVSGVTANYTSPFRAANDVKFILTFDRAMAPGVLPALSLGSVNAPAIPSVPPGGTWKSATQFESAAFTFGPGNEGAFVLSASAATDTNGRVMAPAAVFSFDADVTPPANPVLTLTSSDGNSATVSWSSYSAPVDLNGFRLYLQTANYTTVTPLLPVSGTGKTIRTFKFTGLSPDTNYYAAVVAVDVAGNVTPAVTTLPVFLDSTVPPPVPFTLTSPAPDRVRVDWTPYNTSALVGFQGFRVFLQTSSFSNVTGLTAAATLDANTRNVEFGPLDRTLTYRIAVVGYNRLNEFNPAVTTQSWSDPLSGNITANLSIGTAGVAGTVPVLHSFTVKSGATVTVLPGTTLQFAPGAGLTVDGGALVAEGTPLLPINFTSASDIAGGSPQRGNWEGVTLTAPSNTTRLANLWIRYGKGLNVNGGTATLGPVFAAWNQGAGLHALGSATLSLTNSFFSLNDTGVLAEGTSTVTAAQSVIKNNLTFNAQRAGTATLNLNSNWWGTIDTSEINASISGTVAHATPLAGEPVLTPAMAAYGGVTTIGTRNLTVLLASANAFAFRMSENSLFPGAAWQDIFPAGSTDLFSPQPFQRNFLLSAGAGPKTVYLQFQSVTGQTSTSLSLNVTLVTDGPAIQTFSLTDGQTISRPIQVTGTATAPLGLQWLRFYANDALIASSSNGTLNFRWDMRTLPTAIYRARLVARDNAGNESAREVNVTVSPGAPPPPVIVAPVNNATLAASSVTVNGTAESGITVRVTRNGFSQGTTAAGVDGTFSIPGVGLLEGANQIVAIVEDAVGTASSAPVNVTLDSGPPAAVVLENSPVYDIFRGLQITWHFATSGERASKFRVFWRNAPFASAAQATGQSALLDTLTYTIDTAADGPLYMGVVGYDPAGNASPLSNVIAYQLDRSAPAFTIAYGGPLPAGPGNLDIVLTANEPLAATPNLTITPAGLTTPISVPLTKTTGQTYTATYAVNNLTSRTGTAVVRVSGTDLTGNAFTGTPAGPALMFDVTRPTGALTFDKTPPVKTVSPADPGIAQDVLLSFNLTLDEPVRPGTIPVLHFSPPIGAEINPLLTGAGASWNGSITLTSAMGKGLGQFTMSAEDARGNVGTTVTPFALEIYNTEHPNAPGIPINLQATTLAGGAVKVKWDPVEGAQYYRIYREPGNTGVTPTVLVANNIATTEWTDNIIPADGIYRYAIRAFRVSIEGSPSGTLNALSDRTPPNAPVGFTAVFGTSGVVISWAAPPAGPAPHHYLVYRNGTAIRQVTSPAQITDYPPRGSYNYEIAASDTYGNESRTAPIPLAFVVDPVNQLVAEVRDGQPVTLKWAFGDPVGIGFNVYRNDVKQNGAPVALATPYFVDHLPLPPSEHVDYRVTAVKTGGQEGVPRTIRVLPVVWNMALNINEAGQTHGTVTRYFDSYRVSVENRDPLNPLTLQGIDVNRALSGGETTHFVYKQALAVAAGGMEQTDVPVPGASQLQETQTAELALLSAPDEGGSVVQYIRSGTLPGATDPGVTVDVRLTGTPVAGGLANLLVRIVNKGWTPIDLVLGRQNGQAAGDLAVSVLDQSDAVVSTVEFKGIGTPGLIIRPNGEGQVSLEPGQTVDVPVNNVLVPAALAESGRAKFQAVVSRIYSERGTLNERLSGPLEGVLTSNISLTPYFGSVTTPQDVYTGDQPIVISGTATNRASNNPQANAQMKIGFSARGAVWYQTITADASGHFNFSYTPFSGFAGELTIWAAHPDVFDVLTQKTVRVYRLYVSPQTAQIRMSKNDTLDFTLNLINPGDLGLSGVNVAFRAYRLDVDGVTQIPVPQITGNWKTGSGPGTVKASGRATADLRLSATAAAPDSAQLEVTFSTTEGASVIFKAGLELLPAVPVLSMTEPAPGYVDVSVNRGNITSRQVTIKNLGTRALEGVELVPPQVVPWMQVSLPLNASGIAQLPDIGVGETFTFTVAFIPPEGTPLQYYNDKIKVRGTNAMAGFDFNTFALVTSSQTGGLAFHVTNILGQEVPNAGVRLRNLTTGAELGPSPTAADGRVSFASIAEGKWSWQVTAAGHNTSAGSVDVVPDQIIPVPVELNRSLVTVTFQVRPVPYTDRYEIVIEQTFETFVPAPVMVFTPPKYDFGRVQPGFETTVVYELKNHGLIKVRDIEIKGTYSGALTMEPLIRYLPELGAQQMVEIPVKFRLATMQTGENGGCGGDLTGESDFTPPNFGDTGSFGGVAPTIGNAITSQCATPSLADFLTGIAAIANMAGKGCAQSQSTGTLTTILAVALGVAAGWETATSIPGSGTGGIISIVGQIATALGQCAAAKWGSPGGGGGGSGGGGGGTQQTGFSGGGNGCFPAGTPVLLADGRSLPIEQLHAGDVVRCGSDARDTATILYTYALESSDVLEFNLRPRSGGETVVLKVTGEHRIWKDGTGWVTASQLKPGDWLYRPDGSLLDVQSVKQLSGTQPVFTLQLKGNNAFYANGVLVQDLCSGLFLEEKQRAELQPRAK